MSTNNFNSRENYNEQKISQRSASDLTNPISSDIKTTSFKTELYSTSKKSLASNEKISTSPVESVTNLLSISSNSQFKETRLLKRSSPLLQNDISILDKGYKCRKISNPDSTFSNKSDSAADIFQFKKRIHAEADERKDSTEFQTSPSVDEERVMRAVERSIETENLIGDFSKCFILPLIDGRHQDMKYISSKTLARLIKGDFDDRVVSYKVIDCRYPYEYEGGHISGAVNYYTRDVIFKELIESKRGITPVLTRTLSENQDERKHDIIIFHCEFSLERGPKLCRYLRELDRLCNIDAYPALHFPEMYLLYGGYKEFYENYGELCLPNAYVCMIDAEYQIQYRCFSAQRRRSEKNYKNKFELKNDSKIK